MKLSFPKNIEVPFLNYLNGERYTLHRLASIRVMEAVLTPVTAIREQGEITNRD